MRRGLVSLCMGLGIVATAAAQTITIQADRVVASDRVVIGGAQWGTKSPLRVVGLPSATSETTCLLVDGDGYVVAGSCSGVGGGGTVTSVGLAMPSQFTVTGSPVTSAGTLTASWNAQAATYVLAGPTSGSPAAPTFRALTDDDIPNNLTLGLVSGTPTFLGVTSFDSTIKSSSWMSGLAGWGITAAGTADFRYLTSDELHVKVFVADLQRALAGGQVVSKSLAVVAEELTLPVVGQSVTLWVYDLPGQPDTPVFEANDWVLLQVRERIAGGLLSVDAWGVVTNYQDQTDGRQTWTWTRQNVGSGWTGPVRQDSLAVDYGQSGDGFVWSSALGEFAPFVSVNTWSGTPTTVTTRARVGRLTGITGVTTEYGGLFGDYAGRQYFRASNTDVSLHGVNFTMYEGATPVIAFNRTAPSFALGNPLPGGYGVGTGIWMGKDGSAYKLRIGDPGGNRVTWDGSTLSVVGTLTSTSGTIGGWTLGTTTLTGTNVLLDATGTIRAGAGGGARVELTNAPALRWYSASNALLGAIDSTGMVVNASNVDNNQPEASYRFGNLPGDASMWISGARYTYDTIPVQAMWLVSNVQTTDDTRRGWIRLLSQPADAGGDHAAILEVVGAADNGSTGIPDNPNFQGLSGNPQTKSLIWARLFGGGTFLVDGNMVVNGQVLVPGGFTISGTVELAQALAQNGTNCAVGEAARGIDQYGNAEGCWTPTTGTVTSVGLSLPASVFSVSGSPVTTSGTLTGTFVTQNANTVFAGPTSGGAATPTFRALVKADLPGSVAYRDEANAFTAGVTITSATTPQLSVRSDANNRLDISVSSSGAVTLDAVGTGAALTLPDAVTASSTLSVTGGITANSTLTVAGAATFNGNTTLGDATSDTVTVTARLASGLTWATDNTQDIGASGTNRPRHLYLGGNLAVGGTSTLTGAVTASSDVSVQGNTTLGDATSDTVTITARVASGLAWSADNTYDIGLSGSNRPRDLFVARNTAIGGALTVTGNATVNGTLTATGNTVLGDATSDTVTVTARVASNLTWSTDNAYDIGASGANRPRDVFVARNVSIGGTLGVTGAATFANTVGISGVTTFSSTAQASGWASRSSNWGITVTGSADFRDLFSDELRVRLFTSEMTQAINGNVLYTKSVAELAGEGTLGSDVTCPTAGGASETWWFRDFDNAPNIRVFQTNDYLVIRVLAWADSDNNGAAELTVSDCIVQVSNYADGTGGNEGYQSWTVTRPASGGGSMANGANIPLKTQALNFGVSGNGFLLATVVDGTNNVNAPYFGVVTWTTTPAASNWTNRVRLGQLTGITSTNEYGFFAGQYATSDGRFVRISDQHFDLQGIDLTIWDGTTQAILMRRNAGAPYFSLGNPAPTTYASGTGVWMGDDGGTYKVRIGNPSGNRLTWDGSTLAVTGSITASSGTIGGWTIESSRLTSGSGSTRVGLDTSGTNPAIYAGSDTPGSAPFRVTNAGALTATSGTVGGWTLSTNSLTGGNATLHSSGYLLLGTSNDIARLDAADATYRLWIGHATASSAPFSVTKAGALTATNASITGTITGSVVTGSTIQTVSNCGVTAGSCIKLETAPSALKWFGGNAALRGQLDETGLRFEIPDTPSWASVRWTRPSGRQMGLYGYYSSGDAYNLSLTNTTDSQNETVFIDVGVESVGGNAFTQYLGVGSESYVYTYARKNITLMPDTGGVGIKTTSYPGYALDVMGRVRIGAYTPTSPPAYLFVDDPNQSGLVMRLDATGTVNDTTRDTMRINVGSDATLGPLVTILSSRPSANGINRYASIAVGDNAAWRTLALQPSGGSVVINGTSSSTTFRVNGTSAFTNAIYITGNGGTDRLENVNSSGFGFDAQNSGGRHDLLVYGNGWVYAQRLILGYTRSTTDPARITTYEPNQNLEIDPNGTGVVLFGSSDLQEVAGIQLNNWVENSGNRYVCTDAGTGSTGWILKSVGACGASSRRVKRDIVPLETDWAKVLDIQPVTFRWKDDPQGPFWLGAIAEDVADLGLEWLVERDDLGRPKQIYYDKIVLYLLPIVKELRERLDRLERHIQ